MCLECCLCQVETEQKTKNRFSWRIMSVESRCHGAHHNGWTSSTSRPESSISQASGSQETWIISTTSSKSRKATWVNLANKLASAREHCSLDPFLGSRGTVFPWQGDRGTASPGLSTHHSFSFYLPKGHLGNVHDLHVRQKPPEARRARSLRVMGTSASTWGRITSRLVVL